MCFPLLGLIGAAVSAVGTIASAQAQAQQANYNAAVEEVNATTKRQEAQAEADRVEDKHDTLRGQQLAAASKSGLVAGMGSPAMVINQEGARNQWLDMHNTIWSGQTQAVAHENKAEQYRMEAKSAKQAGAFGAASSFLSGIGGAVKSGSLKIT